MAALAGAVFDMSNLPREIYPSLFTSRHFVRTLKFFLALNYTKAEAAWQIDKKVNWST